MILGEVKVYGVSSQPSAIKINDNFYYNYAYNEYSKVIFISFDINKLHYMLFTIINF